MPAIHVAERLARVRSRVELVFQMLVEPSPEVLARCETLLQAALEEFELSRPFWRTARGDPEALAEACRVRVVVGQAGRLIDTAEAFHLR